MLQALTLPLSEPLTLSLLALCRTFLGSSRVDQSSPELWQSTPQTRKLAKWLDTIYFVVLLLSEIYKFT